MEAKTFFPPLAFLLLAGLGCACSTGSTSASATGPTLASVYPLEDGPKTVLPLASPKDGDYAMTVEMRLASTEGVRSPSDSIPLTNYEPATAGTRLSVRFSDGGRKVHLPSEKVSGWFERIEGKTTVYRLSEGLFAGGRLTVEETGQGLVSTYTVFGSGRPVLSSSRGPLVQAKTQ